MTWFCSRRVELRVWSSEVLSLSGEREEGVGADFLLLGELRIYGPGVQEFGSRSSGGFRG